MHGEIVVFALPGCKLFLEVTEGIELVRCVEVFVVLAVAAFHLAIVPRSEDLTASRLSSIYINAFTMYSIPHIRS